MGEALITRRGGSFDISKLAEFKVYNDTPFNSSGTSITLPETIDFADIQAIILYQGTSTGGIMGIYSGDGKLISLDWQGDSSGNDYTFGDTITLDETTRELRFSKAMGGSHIVNCTIYY